MRAIAWLTTLLAFVGSSAANAGSSARLVESPYFAGQVAADELPPIEERVPETPSVVAFDSPGLEPGRHGGTLRTLVGAAKDVRLMVVYGYARLLAYNRDFELVPDLLEKVDVDKGRRFTLHLRKGHRWSDGHPFTAEDFRYYWEDVANNPELSPLGPPRALMVEGEKATFEVIDGTTVRYSWSKPNPEFLPALARATPLYIYMPAHYLKQFHARYADPERLDRLVEESRRRNWAALHGRLDNQYRNDNPKLPTLQPWINQVRPPSQRFEFTANPYFHRIDPNGRQLPYIPSVEMSVIDSKLIPLKTAAGEVDLQARGLNFNNYTVLKNAEARQNQRVRLWRTAKGAHLALYPNLNANDPVWRKLFRDVRFRRALSLAVNRHEINQVVYFGLALESNNTVLPKSPLYRPWYKTAWASFDLERANRLLDELGLTERGSRGVRLLPDGRPMELVIETAGEDTEQTDVLELVGDSWARVGIKSYVRPSQREVFRNRIFSGATLMSIWSGYENGIPTANTVPDDFVPTDQNHLQWPKWGQYYQTRGQAGQPIDMPGPRRLLELRNAWIDADSTAERESIWHEILSIHANGCFTIGLIARVPQPVVVNNRLRNVPEEGVYNWSPGAHFGVYRPDTFWFAAPDAEGRSHRGNAPVARNG